MLLTKGCICLAVFVAYAACAYPVNPNIIKDFRKITIVYAPLSSPINVTSYEFIMTLANRPSYFSDDDYRFMNNDPRVISRPLLIQETISYRVVGRINGKVPSENDYSPFYNVATKNPSLAQVSVLPGKPLNLAVVKNPDGNLIHSVIVTWDDPTNVQQAVNANDKDLQYKLDICLYNRFEPSKREGCKTYAQILRNKNTIHQTTLSGLKSVFYSFNFHPDKYNELLYIVTPVALNGSMGEAANVFKRIDSAETPPTPSNVNASEIYANQLTLSWVQEVSNAQAYIEISPHHTQHEVRMATSNPFVITGLKNGTEYEFKVGIYTAKTGGSAWSTKYKFSTTNEPKPDPNNSGSNLTASIFTVVMSIFVFLKMW